MKSFDVIRRNEGFVPVGSVAERILREALLGEIQRSFAPQPRKSGKAGEDEDEAKDLLG